jgi:hypothetical protein
MLLLLVKGCKEVATQEALKRGIRFFVEVYCPRSNETHIYANYPVEKASKWYLEDVGNTPYPQGCLLFYNVLDGNGSTYIL